MQHLLLLMYGLASPAPRGAQSRLSKLSINSPVSNLCSIHTLEYWVYFAFDPVALYFPAWPYWNSTFEEIIGYDHSSGKIWTLFSPSRNVCNRCKVWWSAPNAGFESRGYHYHDPHGQQLSFLDGLDCKTIGFYLCCCWTAALQEIRAWIAWCIITGPKSALNSSSMCLVVPEAVQCAQNSQRQATQACALLQLQACATISKNIA